MDRRTATSLGATGRAIEAPPVEHPPAFVRLTSNPIRWRLLRQLGQSDRTVNELTQSLGEPQSLVSYHLRMLREGGLVTARRSAADRRDSYYSVDLAACADAWSDAGAALHPALEPVLDPALGTRTPRPVRRVRAARRARRVLFLCTGNSARSKMAEALMQQMSDGAVRAASAGVRPKDVHPNAVRVLRARGIDISGQRSKHVDELVSARFDLVVTLCDRVREVCPAFPSHPTLVHWSIPDPALCGGSDRATYPAFERAARELEQRIRFRLPLVLGAA